MKLMLYRIVLLLAIISLPAFGVDDSKRITTNTIFNAVAITGSSSSTSAAIPLVEINPEGYFSFTLTTAGAGSVVKAEYLVCDTVDGTYYEPYGKEDIVTAHSPGTAIYSFAPPVAKYMKIKLTETNGSNVTAAMGIITIQ